MQPDSVYGDQLLGRGSSRDPLLGVCLKLKLTLLFLSFLSAI